MRINCNKVLIVQQLIVNQDYFSANKPANRGVTRILMERRLYWITTGGKKGGGGRRVQQYPSPLSHTITNSPMQVYGFCHKLCKADIALVSSFLRDVNQGRWWRYCLWRRLDSRMEFDFGWQYGKDFQTAGSDIHPPSPPKPNSRIPMVFLFSSSARVSGLFLQSTYYTGIEYFC